MRTTRFLWLSLLLSWVPLATAEPVPIKISVGGVERHALVCAPANAGKKPLPLVLAFHGHGGSEVTAEKWMAFQNAWPEAIAVYPQGLPTATDVDPKGLKPGWQRRPGELNDRDVKFVDALLTKLRQEYSIDEHRVFAVGFSNGAFFTYLLWDERPQLFAGFGIVAGRRDLAGQLTVPKPAVQIGGRADRLVHLKDVEEAMAIVRKLNGCAPNGEPCGPGCVRYSSSKGAPVINWIHPGPHVYPPGSTQLIADFFKSL